MIKCGIYEHDITPALGAQIPGYFSKRFATGIKEKLCAEAAVFAKDDKIVSVIVTADTIGIPKNVCDRSRSEIAAKLALDEAAVTVHATHVHTGGPTLTGFITDRDDVYCNWMGDRMVEAAVIASQHMEEVKIGFGRDYDYTIANYRDRICEDGIPRTNHRNSKPFGKIDPEVACIVLDRPDGSHYGVIANYACHTDCVGGSEFSTDFPGAMRETLRKTYGDDFHPVFLNGFFGNINHIDFDNNKHAVPGYYRKMGVKLAGRVISAIEDRDVVWFENPEFRASAKRIMIKHRQASEWEINWATEELKKSEIAVNDKYFAEDILRVAQLPERELDVCVQVQKIGGINLFACPREMFVEFGFMLKEGSDSKYNLTTCNSNGDCGYVQIKELITPTVYESRLNEGKLVPEAGYMMVDTMLELMKTL